jgi:hypothetical protein
MPSGIRLRISGAGWVPWLERVPGLHGPFKPEEVTRFYLFATVAIVSVTCNGWFFFMALFYEKSSPEYKARVEKFFARLKTPVGDWNEDK